MVGHMDNEFNSWQANARCAGAPSALFFNDEINRTDCDFREYCNECPVKNECLEYALLYNMSGVWGGTTDKERARLYHKDYVTFLRDDAIESGMFNFELKA